MIMNITTRKLRMQPNNPNQYMNKTIKSPKNIINKI